MKREKILIPLSKIASELGLKRDRAFGLLSMMVEFKLIHEPVVIGRDSYFHNKVYEELKNAWDSEKLVGKNIIGDDGQRILIQKDFDLKAEEFFKGESNIEEKKKGFRKIKNNEDFYQNLIKG